MLVAGVHYRTIWLEGRTVRMIDQTLLPFRFAVHDSPGHEQTARCIRDMVVRGAGAIGAAGGYGVAQAALEAPDDGFEAFVEAGARHSRPPAPRRATSSTRSTGCSPPCVSPRRRRVGCCGAAGSRGRGRGGRP